MAHLQPEKGLPDSDPVVHGRYHDTHQGTCTSPFRFGRSSLTTAGEMYSHHCVPLALWRGEHKQYLWQPVSPVDSRQAGMGG
ncbi:hypothetical protein GCM10007108_04330 [Thermogymnomonas acidicola]|uniref:Uncharacterized protein n=1 Tax=Thermogymnomonas acidicola TaxID=399579 RepID=A0AA37F933_9ARCH|nr:hypothetical protein GCM10007108_04330 [Thermogymnomonas acidicola]